MQVVRQKLIRCPCCESDFFIQYSDEFYIHPISDEQNKFLTERQDRENEQGIKTRYIS